MQLYSELFVVILHCYNDLHEESPPASRASTLKTCKRKPRTRKWEQKAGAPNNREPELLCKGCACTME